LDIKATGIYAAKTGLVGTNYTTSHNRPFLSTATEYLWSVTCSIKSIKCLIRVAKFMAIGDQQKKIQVMKV